MDKSQIVVVPDKNCL